MNTNALRQKILDLAIHGKLVDSEQTEPRHAKVDSASVHKDEKPFELPQGWKWVKLGEICGFIGGGTPCKSNADYWNGNINWASVKDIKGEYLYETEDKITEDGVKIVLQVLQKKAI